MSACPSNEVSTTHVFGIISRDAQVGFQRVFDGSHIERYGYVHLHLRQPFFRESTLWLLVVALKEYDVRYNLTSVTGTLKINHNQLLGQNLILAQ